MRETPDARQAFNDYVALGADRSLEKLLAEYRRRQSDGKATVPTLRLRTIETWSVAHSWQARLAEMAEAERRAIVARGIAEKQNRIDILDNTVKRITGLIEARSTDPLCLAAGHDTGLVLTKKVMYVVGEGGEEIGRVEEYATDGVVLKELREYLKQAAQELGQWVEKGELTGKDGAPLTQATVIVLPNNGRGDRQ